MWGGCKIDCKKISKEHSKEIFLNYWKPGSKESQTTFIRSMVDVVPVKQKTAESSIRNISRKYRLKFKDNMYNVCQKTFIATLGITEKLVRTAVCQNNEYGGAGISLIDIKPRNPRPSRGFIGMMKIRSL